VATVGADGRVSVIFSRYFERMTRAVVAAGARALADAGPQTVAFIRTRTLRGVDRHGRRFKAYRPATVKRRRAKGLTTTVVNLQESGLMLGELDTRRGLEFRSVDVYFRDREAARRARFHIFGTRRMAARDFFGLHPLEVRLLFEAFRAEVRASVPRDRRRTLTLVVLPSLR